MNLRDAPDLAWVAQPMRLKHLLESYFGDLDDATVEKISAQCQAVDLRGGEMLFSEGDPGDSLYFLVGGRLSAVTTLRDGSRRVLGHIEPGAPVGEMAVINDSVRSASVVAVRDSTLLRIDAAQVRAWFLAYPQILLKTSRLAIQRALNTERRRRGRDVVVNLAIVPLSPDIDMARFRTEFRAGLSTLGSCLMLESSILQRLGTPDGAQSGPARDDADRHLTHWLNSLELEYDFVVYCGDGHDSVWTRRCLRQADRVVLLADAQASREPGPVETALAGVLTARVGPGTMLALWHPEHTAYPEGTRGWLKSRPWVHEHAHVRRGDARHAARLARLATGHAIGLVLGSGGARGLAHIGVFQAMCEAGIAVDRVGGSSIGSVIAAGVACDFDAEELAHMCRLSFGANPGSWRDLSIPPVFALYRGDRLERMLARIFPPNMGLEDLWLNFFCVSSDMTNSEEVVHTRGPLTRVLRASVALPGIFPPVRLDHALHVDGALMNTLPTEVMSALGVHRLYAVDLRQDRMASPDFMDVPGPLAYLFARWFQRHKHRYRVPTLTSTLVQSSMMSSEARVLAARRQVDVLFNPDVRRFSLMGWSKIAHDRLVATGLQHARQVLAAHPLRVPLRVRRRRRAAL